jgi:hypothetical protein
MECEMQGTGHTAFERRLRGDIAAKNALSEEYEDKIRLARHFGESAEEAVGRRWRKKYAKTAARLLKEADTLRVEVLRRIQDLEPRIRQEMQFSDLEVAAFQAQFEKEHREWLEAQKSRQATAESLRRLTTESGLLRRKMTADQDPSIEEARGAAVRSESVERREKKDVERVDRELDSEARDKNLFTRELQRIVAERITLSS